MWFRRHKPAVPETSGEVPPPPVAPTRRIEITVERHSVARLSRSNGAEPAETTETQPALPAPPDG
jgi:hypothetical protein